MIAARRALMSIAHPLALLLLLALPGPAAASGQTTAPESFESSARRAQIARDAGRDAEAIAAYRDGLALRPAWEEGLWYLGTLLYQSGKTVEADDTFARFLELQPRAGAGWVLRGLCAFAAADYKTAAERLHRGLGLGLGGNAELEAAGRLRLALALVKTYQFELAIQPLTLLARTVPDKPEVIDAVGLAFVRLALLPSEIPEARRDLVRKTGQAGVYHLAERGSDADRAYKELVAAYPLEPWLHYAQGVFLLRTDSERGLEALHRELQINPGNVMACLSIAFEHLQLRQYVEARTVAERAVELSPTLFATHHALGQALTELGEVDRAIVELQTAVRLAPESAQGHFALARAYARAGREADAARERAEFTRLDKERAAASGSTPRTPGEVRP